MDSDTYSERYFRPDKPLHLYGLVRLEPVDAPVNSPLSGMVRLSLISSSPRSDEMMDEFKSIRSRGDTDSWAMMEWIPLRGLRLQFTLNYGGADHIQAMSTTGDEVRKLAERMAVLGVLANLGFDVQDGDSCIGQYEVQNYLAHR